jgi:regulatory protein
VNVPGDRIRLTGREEDLQAGRLLLTTSDGATWEVAPSAPEARGLEVGDALDAPALDGLRFAAGRKAAAREALERLGRRFHSARRLRLRLLQSGHEEAAVDAVVAQLLEQGVLDDVRFAEAWCRDQLARKPVGRRWLQSGLHDHGVSEEALAAALDACLPPEAEEDACRRALASRRYDLQDEANQARALRFLMSRGFGRDLARRVLFARVRLQRAEDGA